MASSIVDELFDRLIRAFPPDRSYGQGAISRDPMPPPVARFLKQLLRRRLDLEMRNIRDASSPWIDYEHPEVQRAARAFRTVIESHLRIPKSEWQGMLRRAVQRTTAYLIHPTQTMTNFVFGDREGELPVHVIRERIQFFLSYPYLHEAVSALIDREEAPSMSRTRFETLITRIDERMVADYSVDDWMRLLDPLFNLLAVVDQRGVPVSFLQTFFQCKGASDVVQRLQAASLEQGTTMLARSDLRDLLTTDTASAVDDVPPSAVPTASPPRSPAPEDVPQPSPEPSSEPSPEPSTDGATPDGPTPLWKQFQHADPPEEKPKRVEAVTDDSDEPLWARFRPTSEPSASSSQPPPEADLATLERAVLGERGRSSRDLFIRALFGGSRDEYIQTLRRLRAAPNWTRASQIIAQDVFRAHRVNIYSKPAVTFTNAVEDRFRRRS